ncbi:MAG: phosphatidate cytidylyltransferase, partial [Holosporales bacterium]|nr:phosphatidate cytidylyltransferase [Holosporales bacterium]
MRLHRRDSNKSNRYFGREHRGKHEQKRSEKREELFLRALSSVGIVAVVVMFTVAGKYFFYVLLSAIAYGIGYEWFRAAKQKDFGSTACLGAASLLALLTRIHLCKLFGYIAFIVVYTLLGMKKQLAEEEAKSIEYLTEKDLAAQEATAEEDQAQEAKAEEGQPGEEALGRCAEDAHNAKLQSAKLAGWKHKCIASIGYMYIYLSLYGLGYLYNTFGPRFILFIFVCIWLTDAGAFFVGKLIGGKKLAPRLSPGKTWSGFWGGIATA